jgi:hypothetical protein
MAPPSSAGTSRLCDSVRPFRSPRNHGASDFLAGLKARTLSTVVVAAVSQGAGLLFAAAIVAARGRPPPGPEFVVYALLTGVAAAVWAHEPLSCACDGPDGHHLADRRDVRGRPRRGGGPGGREAQRPAVDRDPRVHRRRGAMAMSVLSALYPVVTAALARVVLHERLSAWQLTGAGLALLGVLLITIA